MNLYLPVTTELSQDSNIWWPLDRSEILQLGNVGIDNQVLFAKSLKMREDYLNLNLLKL